MSVAWPSEETGGRRRRPRLAGCRLISTESLTDVCSGGLRCHGPLGYCLFGPSTLLISFIRKKPAWNFGRAYTRARTRWHTDTATGTWAPRLTAASRSPLLIAATLVNESISTGRRGASQQRLRSGAPQPQRYLYTGVPPGTLQPRNVSAAVLLRPLPCVKAHRARNGRGTSAEGAGRTHAISRDHAIITDVRETAGYWCEVVIGYVNGVLCFILKGGGSADAARPRLRQK